MSKDLFMQKSDLEKKKFENLLIIRVLDVILINNCFCSSEMSRPL